jgi:peptide/nickel transport system substrate-binding protein
MRSGSKRLAGLVAIAAATLLVAGACGTSKSNSAPQTSEGFASCAKNPNTCNSGPTKPGGTMVVTDEKKVTSFFVADAASNTYDQAQIMNALLPAVFNVNPDMSLFLNTDMMVSADQTSDNPQTIVYKINPNAVWNDGTPISADDFDFTWKFQNGVDCKPADCPVATTLGYDAIKSLTPSDNGKTVTVVFAKTFPDWKSLFTLYPAHIAKQYAGGSLSTPADYAKAYKGFLSEGASATNIPKWSGGPYVISSFDPNTQTELTPNPKWYGKTKPSLEKIVFKLILDPSQETTALKNGEVNVTTMQPDSDAVAAVQQMQDVNYNLMSGPTWEHIDLNLKNKFLADKPLRQAIFTAINRQTIIDRTVKPFFPQAAPLNNHNYMPNQPGYKDVITPTGQGTGDAAKAAQILTTAGYKGAADGQTLTTPDGTPVKLSFSYTQSNKLRETTAELVQADLAKIGIKLTLVPKPDLGFLGTGDYDMVVFAWVGTPFVSGNRDLWATNGGGNYGKYSNPQADTLLSKASLDIDPTQQAADFNAADTIMADDAYVLPLYQKPVFLAASAQFVNIRNNATSVGPSYNIQDWGLKASAK